MEGVRKPLFRVVVYCAHRTKTMKGYLFVDFARRAGDLTGDLRAKKGERNATINRRGHLVLRFATRTAARKYAEFIEELPVAMGLTTSMPAIPRERSAKAQTALLESRHSAKQAHVVKPAAAEKDTKRRGRRRA